MTKHQDCIQNVCQIASNATMQVAHTQQTQMTRKRPEPAIYAVIRLLCRAGDIVGKRRMRLHLVDAVAQAIAAAWKEADHIDGQIDKRRKRG